MTKKSTPAKKSPATKGAKTVSKPAKEAPKKSFDDEDDDLDMEDDEMDVDYDKDLGFEDDDDDDDDY